MRCANCGDLLAPQDGPFGVIHANGLYSCDVPANMVEGPMVWAESQVYPEYVECVITGNTLIEELTEAIARLKGILNA